jgi:signal transduction histidine kinase
MDAVLMIGEDVEYETLLQHIVTEACSLVGARYGAIGVLNASRTGIGAFLTVGITDEEVAATGDRPTGRGVLGVPITEPVPLRLARISEHPDSYGFPPGHPPMTSFLGVPIRVRTSEEPYGILYLTDKIGASEFSDEDEALAEGLALAAGIAIQNTRLHERVRVLSVLDDRNRIAMALHDTVIQRLYASGLALQGAARQLDPDVMVGRVNLVIDDLDTTITEIRSAIFGLEDRSVDGLRNGVLTLTEELTPSLGARPQVTFSGPIDSKVPPNIADHLLAVLREALTNASKHARASSYTVALRVGEDLCLEVSDNGIGIPAPEARARGMGLGNLANRAAKLKGSFEIEAVEGGGTRVVWRVPL